MDGDGEGAVRSGQWWQGRQGSRGGEGAGAPVTATEALAEMEKW